MLKQSQIDGLAPKARILQIIAGSLIMGVVMATVLLLFVADLSEAGFDTGPLTLIGLGALAVSIVMSLFVPTLVAKAGIEAARGSSNNGGKKDFGKEPDDSLVNTLANVFQTKTIVRFALIEGACFLNAVLMLLEKSWFSPLAVVFGILVMLVFFPTLDRMVQFIENSETA